MKKFALLIIATCCAPVAPLAACASSPRLDPRAAAFTAELVACVEKSPTREASKSCRDAVEAKYDGGAK